MASELWPTKVQDFHKILTKPTDIQTAITSYQIGFKTRYFDHLVAHKIAFHVVYYMASFDELLVSRL